MTSLFSPVYLNATPTRTHALAARPTTLTPLDETPITFQSDPNPNPLAAAPVAKTLPPDATMIPTSTMPLESGSVEYNPSASPGSQPTHHGAGGEKAEQTFTGAPEPEGVSRQEQERYEGDAVQQSPTSTGATDPANANAGGATGEKLPFKEQVKAYAKVHRGTLLGDVSA